MAKKKKGAGAQDVDEMSKSELKAYHKEICDYYLENGWRDTLSHFLLSPTQAGEITGKVRAKKEKEEAAAKKKRKGKKKKSSKKAPKKKKAKAKKEKPKKTKAKVPKKKPAKKRKAKAKKKTGKRRGRPPGKKVGLAAVNANLTVALDVMLKYRGNRTGVSLDEAIVDLTIVQKKAA